MVFLIFNRLDYYDFKIAMLNLMYSYIYSICIDYDFIKYYGLP